MHTFRERMKFYLQSTSLHGLRYVADEERYSFIRILWVGVFITSVVLMFIIFYGSYVAYKYHSISFVTETTYLDWNTNFPAVTICETTGNEVYFPPGPDEDVSALQQFFAEVIFFSGTCYSCGGECEECERYNFRDVAKQFRKQCYRLLKHCKWNNKSFDCCQKFLPIDTEYGFCYSINSDHTIKKPGSEINMKSNRKTGPGHLYIEVIEDIRMYFHAPEDVPFINLNSDQRKEISLGEKYNLTLNIVEIANDVEVKDVTFDKRECRFPWEIPDDMRVHQVYSYASCVVQCHANAQFKLCNCTHHLMPTISDEGYCNIEGLQCLTDNFETLNRLHAPEFDKPGLVCKCIPSCVEPEYSIVLEQTDSGFDLTRINIKLQALPTFRFKRNVVRSTMDLVVSIGGTAGLFIGASLLSIIETPYLLIMRRRS